VCFSCALLWRCVSAVWRLYQTAKITNVKEQWICIKFCFKLSKTASETHSMLEEAFHDNALGQTQTYERFKRFKNGRMSVDDEEHTGWPSTGTRPKMWQKSDTEGIVHKVFVPPGQMVNGKFYCGILRQLTENIWHKRQDKWAKTSGPSIMTMLRLMCRSMWKLLSSTKMTVILHPP